MQAIGDSSEFSLQLEVNVGALVEGVEELVLLVGM